MNYSFPFARDFHLGLNPSGFSVAECHFSVQNQAMLNRFILPLIAFCLWTTAVEAAQLSGAKEGHLLRLGIEGTPGNVYTLEKSNDPAAGWTPVSRWTLTNSVQDWAEGMLGDAAFFRLREDGLPGFAPFAENFRLIDHQDRSRELWYYETNKAVVLIFMKSGCTNLIASLPELRAIRSEFGARGVVFWMVASDLNETRTNLVAEASRSSIDFPILHDADQNVAREYDAAVAPDVVAINTFDWTVFYRGSIDSRVGTNAATDRYLRGALNDFMAGRPVSLTWTAPGGCEITMPQPREIDYSTEIAPLLMDKCVRCHSPGNIAPLALTNYDSVVLWSSLMKHAVMDGHMPPWHADPQYSRFANDGSLSPEQRRTLIQWIDAGNPRGAGPDILTNVPPPPPAWALGQPDIIMTIPKQTLPASGTIDYRYITITNTYSNMWLRAAVIRPGNSAAVHHCLVYFGSNSVAAGIDGFFAGYVPGLDPVEFPAGTGKYLRLGEILRFQMHYMATGQVEEDQTQLGLYVVPTAPAKELKTKSAFNYLFSIPPRHPDYQVTAEYRFTRAARIYEFSPHMHYRGSRFKYEALYPDGRREILLSVPKYEFDWQTLYRLAVPKDVPAGTTLLCTGAFDNSPQNHHNPDPNVTVRFGDQTWEEMFIGYFNYVDM